jgi:hypothetical protein
MEGISLGWNCSAAQYGTYSELRKIKSDGYKTCPFDMMISNYVGLYKCIDDDFKNFCNPDFLELKPAPNVNNFIPNQKDGEMWIHNTYYNFVFNHESPYHGNLYLNEQWSSPNHFVDNNFEKFIERYKQRINNLREYINKSDYINFILWRYNDIPYKLVDIINKRYSNLKYKINVITDFSHQNIGCLIDTSDICASRYEKYYLNYMGISDEKYPNEHKRYDLPKIITNININENIKLITI